MNMDFMVGADLQKGISSQPLENRKVDDARALQLWYERLREPYAWHKFEEVKL
ncbi:hypothetical protein [Listeria ilorinensis]|uniref:hypothetical protein n=1 Tax=Listeria ilorinensis TaxID=2867439 RepID=UPI001EF622F0|nr:hypothetical protein [Listeria ilorinensis]